MPNPIKQAQALLNRSNTSVRHIGRTTDMFNSVKRIIADNPTATAAVFLATRMEVLNGNQMFNDIRVRCYTPDNINQVAGFSYYFVDHRVLEMAINDLIVHANEQAERIAQLEAELAELKPATPDSCDDWCDACGGDCSLNGIPNPLFTKPAAINIVVKSPFKVTITGTSA